MLSHMRNRAPAAHRLQRLGGGRHLDLDRRRRGSAARTASYAAVSRPGGELVVVLDHRDVVEAHPLVGAAAAAHGVLLQRAHARASSCGCRAPSRRCPRARRPSAGCGSRRPRAGDRMLSIGPLGDEDRPGRPRAGVARTSPRSHPRAVRRPAARRSTAPDPSRAATASSTRATTGSPATTPSARATMCGVPRWSAGMVASVVTSVPVGPRSSSRARPRRAARASAVGEVAVGRSCGVAPTGRSGWTT